MRDPEFWWSSGSLQAKLLKPAALVYGAVAASRMRKQGARANVPVICVGNFTLGGAGKTPTAIAIARMLVEMGETPVFLSRGYGGQEAGPLKVNVAKHRASDVGDEPLLLARQAPVIVAQDRVAGAALAEAEGASVIVMDDGLQNPSLRKDVTLAVVDARRGIGNEEVFPAGPLRAPLKDQLALTNMLLWIGDRPQRAANVVEEARTQRIPVLQGQLKLDKAALKTLERKKILAFAGIGDPEKFFSALAAAGIEAVIEENFPDHHPYTADDALRLLARCDERGGLTPITTEKDFVRLSGNEQLAKLAARTRAVPVSLEFSDPKPLRGLIQKALDRS